MGQGSASSSEIHLDSFGYWLLYRQFESSWDMFEESNAYFDDIEESDE